MARVPEITYNLSSLFQNYRDTALLDRIETYARWTIPSVFPDSDYDMYRSNTNAAIEYDYQSIGALLVNRLATKLARTLFPANTSFFRIDVTNEQVKAIFAQRKVDSIIEYENAACQRLFLNAAYAQVVQMMRLLVITGECLLTRVDNTLRVYSLRDYSVKRNNTGQVLDLVLCERKFYEELDENTQALLAGQKSKAALKLYTRIQRQVIKGITSWKVTQEVNGVPLPTNMTYRDKLCPYIPVTWDFVNGDTYGRGYIENYAADFAKLSDLSRELMSYELEALRLLHFVDPSGGVDIDSAATAPNGEFISGVAGSITPYEGGEYQKIQTIINDLAVIEQRLNSAFMYTGNTREGERVTAYEIRQNAEEAEQVLGGVYSQLAESLHLPLAYLLLYEVRPDIIVALDRADIQLNILTGIQALSRSTENQGMLIACSELNGIIPILTQLGKRFNMDAIVDKVFQANGINIKEITYTESELRAKAAAENAAIAQQQQLTGTTGLQQLAGQGDAISAVQQAQTY